ncbi:phosphofructokinase [Candidatus Rickettsiella viridis]|uniref:Pyrophosphate--fructose 6-phosphate 1-phosphotransferase n=1 Tax=Candidatus Rickettsiella viridis TaxID=676208 RepID=A0A2Z5UTQ9_9COXI|nr:6-phosphofructokinase [Candidatus Rickettsiella viridis]BBB14834.1 phosphofructokinase [Candidatus Rickettsiella viridis]
MSKKNAFYAQSGGVTAVINATACGLIETARQHKSKIGKVYAGCNGIIGALTEDLIDTSKESSKAIAGLRYTPGGAFGSCRYKLKGLEENRAEYERLLAVFVAHNIGYFFYNGGGDSQDTAYKISLLSKERAYPLTCIGIPKTVDNDLPFTDNSPGFGSVAKYIAISTREAGLDVASMCATSTKVFIMEVMGRHTGWIAAASGLAAENQGEPPHIILFPEIVFNEAKFLDRVNKTVKRYGYCVIVLAEGVRDANNEFLVESKSTDAFGHKQLGGAAPTIAELIKSKLGFKYHWALPDYLQRSARHIASAVDVKQAYALGKAAIEFAIKGKNGVMPIIIRKSGKRYQWTIGEAKLVDVANQEKKMPRNFISADGFHITPRCREYLLPLIQGEDYPAYKHGLPDYMPLKNQKIAKKLKKYSVKE